jgi:phosphate transport system protein
MSTPLENRLNLLNEMFLNYCTQIEENVQLATQAFLKTDAKRVQDVIDNDYKIDQLEIEIEEECLQIIARYQPLARDLRFIIGILKMNNDLERIGDLAVNIVKKVIVFKNNETSLSQQKNTFNLTQMIDETLHMLNKSIESFIKKDPALARDVCQLDDKVDGLKREMKVLVLHEMKESPDQMEQLVSILKNSSHLERIADLATNIAEDVIYWVEGDIIRHSRKIDVN